MELHDRGATLDPAGSACEARLSADGRLALPRGLRGAFAGGRCFVTPGEDSSVRLYPLWAWSRIVHRLDSREDRAADAARRMVIDAEAIKVDRRGRLRIPRDRLAAFSAPCGVRMVVAGDHVVLRAGAESIS